MSTLASLMVMLGLDARGFHKGVTGAEGSTKGLLGTLGRLAAPTAILGGLAAVGKMAFDAGQQFDEATDTIATKTGATGTALQGLQSDFKAVFTSIPTDAATASSAMAELETRTGASGKVLQDLTKPLLEVSRLTGGDATTNAGLFARVMGDWGIPVNEGAAALDKLFVASQKTGAPIDGLMQKVVQFGAPLRLMGFSLEESAALFGKWEKEGVNAELVMGSLRIAAGKFAGEGKPLRESLLGTFDAIEKNTDASAALALGMKVFGARAGPDMVAAIREGRFSIDDLTAAMGSADGAIMKTAASTADFPEKLQVLRNKATTAMAPMGLQLMDLLTQGAEKLGPIIDQLLPYLPQLGGAMAALGIAAVALSGPIGVIGLAIGALALAWATDFGGIQEKTAAVWAVLQPIFAALVSWLQENIPIALKFLAELWTSTLLPALKVVWAFIQNSVVPIFKVILAWIGENLPPAMKALAVIWNTVILPALTAVWEFISTFLVPALKAIFAWIGENLPPVLRALAAIWNTVILPAIKAIYDFVTDKLIPGFKALSDYIRGGLTSAFNHIKGVFDSVKGGIDSLRGVIESVIGAIRDALSWVDNLINKINSIKMPTWPFGGNGGQMVFGDGASSATSYGMATAAGGSRGAGGSVTINLYGPVVREDADIERLADAIGNVLAGRAHVNRRLGLA